LVIPTNFIYYFGKSKENQEYIIRRATWNCIIRGLLIGVACWISRPYQAKLQKSAVKISDVFLTALSDC